MQKSYVLLGFLIVAGVILLGFAVLNQSFNRKAGEFTAAVDRLPQGLIDAVRGIQ